MPFLCHAESLSVTMDKAGTLEAELNGKQFEITSLKVAGPINGTDVRLLREMCGIDFDNYRTTGQLSELDLSEAVIVAGGEAYYLDTATGGELFTSANTIGTHFFENCMQLSVLSIPSSVTKIEDEAFITCTLKSIKVPESNISFTTVDGGLYTKDLSELIVYANAATPPADGTIQFPEGLKLIRAYSGCQLPAYRLILPSTLVTIEPYAFYSATDIETFNIPEKLTDISAKAFLVCPNISSITIDEANPYFKVKDNVVFTKDMDKLIIYPAGKRDSSYSIPSTITEIGDCSFFYNQHIEEITIGDNVNRIGISAFAYCSALKHAEIPATVKVLEDYTFQECTSLADISLPDEMTSLGAWTFDSTALTEFKFPKGITELEVGLFYGCANIKEFVLPETITSIGEAVFHECTNAKSINIPASIRYIGPYAFMSCKSLEGRVVIPEGITDLHYAAFMWDSSISELVLPSSLKNVGDFVFVGMEGLHKIEANAVTPPACGSNVFFKTPETVKLLVPEEALDNYKTADPWNRFEIETFAGVREIEGENATAIRRFTIDGRPGYAAHGITIEIDRNGKVKKTINSQNQW